MAKYIKNESLSDGGGSSNAYIPTARSLYFKALQKDAQRQEALEREFFSSIKLKNGTYKYTYSRRLDDLNRVVEQLLPAARPLQLMDVAISSGISTLEWMESLAQAGIEHQMTAGDLTINSYLISVSQNLHVLVDKTGYPLQFDIGGKAVANPPGRRRRAMHFLPLMKINKTLRELFPDIKAAMEEGKEFEHSVVSCRQVPLVSPRLKKPNNLRLIEDDILNSTDLSRSFHIIRAANILHREYFDDQALAKIVNNLRSRLLDNGLLIICKTENPPLGNMASVYKLNRERRFEILTGIGGGSELDQLMLELPPEAK